MSKGKSTENHGQLTMRWLDSTFESVMRSELPTLLRLYYEFYFTNAKRRATVYIWAFGLSVFSSAVNLAQSGNRTDEILKQAAAVVLLSLVLGPLLLWPKKVDKRPIRSTISSILLDSLRSEFIFGTFASVILLALPLIAAWSLSSRQPPNMEIYRDKTGLNMERASVREFEDEKFQVPFRRVNTAVTHFQLAEQAFAAKRFDEAERQYRESIEAVPTTSAHTNLAVTIYLSGSVADAKRSFAVAREAATKRNQKRLMEAVLNNIGIVHAAEGDPQKALAVLSEALTIAQRWGSAEGQAVITNNITRLHESIKGDRLSDVHFGEMALQSLGRLLKHAGEQETNLERDLETARALISGLEPTIYAQHPELVKELRAQLVYIGGRYKDLPNAYWPLASHLAPYAYLNNVGLFLEHPTPACPASSGLGFAHAVVANCELALDGKFFEDVTFDHVLIRYSGGPLTLRSVMFQHCHFELQISHAPPPGGQTFIIGILQLDRDSARFELP